MNDWIKKTVTGVAAGIGTYLVAWGVVDANAWATTVTPDVIAGVAAVVGVIVAGVWNKVVGWAMDAVAGGDDE